MAVKVLITREFKPDKTREAHQLLKELRVQATVQPGYVSGQTLVSADKPNKLVVISTWENKKQWEAWQADAKRREHREKMKELLEVPEESELFYVGEPTS